MAKESSINKDVVVIGAGSAGVCASIAAARQGASVVLVDRLKFLGGTITGAWINPLMTFHNFKGEQVISGIAQEIVDRLIEINGAVGHIRDTIGVSYSVTPYDFEKMKKIMGIMLEEADVEVLLGTVFFDVFKEAGFIKEVKAESKGRIFKIKGKVFIDASGDGSLASACGLPFQRGNKSGFTQPFTLIFKVTGVDLREAVDAVIKNPENFHPTTMFERLLTEKVIGISGFFKEIRQANLSVQRDRVLFFSTLCPGEVLVNMTRVSGHDPLKKEDISSAMEEARRQAFEIYNFLKAKIPGFKKSHFAGTAPCIGIRESRRITGEYILTEEDVLEGRDFQDSVARGAFSIDIHNPADNTWEGKSIKKDYGIPYRCLINKTVENLIFSGRCLSATFEAHGSARLAPTCMDMGQASGIAAAISAGVGIPAVLVKADMIQKILHR